MIQRYNFYVNRVVRQESDGDHVRYEDHVTALTVDDAMVERANAAFLGALVDGPDPMRIALEAALAPERAG